MTDLSVLNATLHFNFLLIIRCRLCLESSPGSALESFTSSLMPERVHALGYETFVRCRHLMSRGIDVQNKARFSTDIGITAIIKLGLRLGLE